MSELLKRKPYAQRDETAFLAEMNQLVRWHLNGCQAFAKLWSSWDSAEKSEELPFLHVGAFKHHDFKTTSADIKHERVLKSSATTSGVSSRITLDEKSSKLQSESSRLILEDFLGAEKRPLLIIDSPSSLRTRGEISARIAAAMSLRPLSSGMYFMLDAAEDHESFKLDLLEDILEKHDDLLVYGFTWILWRAWAGKKWPEHIAMLMQNKRITFVHSGGWKKLEEVKVDRGTFDLALIGSASETSKVVDFYGLVEQAGVVYPLCPAGYRHVPLWADVLVRDPFTMASLEGQVGLLQFVNTISFGAPYFSVLTEDMGELIPGNCTCGRLGKRFVLHGRIPRAEVRGCSNV